MRLSTKIFKFILVMLVIAFGASNIIQNVDPSYYSPFDEHTHFDYWYKIYHDGRIPAKYELLGQYPVDVWACSKGPAFAHMLCGEKNDIKSAPFAGESAATANLPTYYLATALISSVASTFFNQQGLALAKYSSAIWGIGTLILSFLLLAKLKTPFLFSLMAMLLISSMPSLIYLSGVVNPEIFAAFFSLLTILSYFWFSSIKSTAIKIVIWSVISAIGLTVKPSLIEVMVVMAFLIGGVEKNKVKYKESFSYIILTIVIFGVLTLVINYFRGFGSSNGLMKSLLLSLPGMDFKQKIQIVLDSFLLSMQNPGLGWKSLNMYSSNFLIEWVPLSLLASGVTATLYGCFNFIKTMRVATLRIFVGWTLSLVLFPLGLYFYLLAVKFPFFFQPRYFLPSLIIGIILLAGLLSELLHSAIRGRNQVRKLI
jgi:uncharacterized membrane protein